MLKNGEENLTCQLEVVKPTVENVTPYALYEQTQPRLKGVSLVQQNELPILYGGGRDFLLGRISQADEPFDMTKVELVDFFILNTCIVIWINALDRGLRVPYQKVAYHGVRRIEDNDGIAEGHTLEILLTIQMDPLLAELFPPSTDQTYSDDLPWECTMSTVELILRPKYAEIDRHYNDQVESLFTFKEFGLNRGDTLVANCNSAIATCMDFYYVADESEEEEEKMAVDGSAATYTGLGEFLQGPAVYQNDGAADDLGESDRIGNKTVNDGAEAGMALEFCGNEQLAGRKQRWESDAAGQGFYKRPKG